jgi:predicted NodU family carbamoyl transferase
MSKPIYVLGTGLSHDGSACLLKDGKICAAIEKERITRRKYDGGNDTETITYCLEKENITLNDIDLIVQNSPIAEYCPPRIFENGCRAPVITISHHLAHAYSACYGSDFDECAVLVLDGCGNTLDLCTDRSDDFTFYCNPLPNGNENNYGETNSYYHFKDNKCTLICKEASRQGHVLEENKFNLCENSIGMFYSLMTMYCFANTHAEGKLMGLAPYGNPSVYNEEVFHIRDGVIVLDHEVLKKFGKPLISHSHFKKNFQQYADAANWAQRELERAIVFLLNSRYELFPAENLAYSGGVALNAVMNSKILKKSPFRRLYIQPAAGDNGISIGCAYYGWLNIMGRPRVPHSPTTCFGKVYASETVKDSLRNYYNTNPVPIKKEIDEFFKEFKATYNRSKLRKENLVIQVNIENAGIYHIGISSKGIKIKNDVIGRPTSEVSVLNTDFYELLQNPNRLSAFFEERRITTTDGAQLSYLLDLIDFDSTRKNGSWIGPEDYLQLIHYEGEGYIEEAARLLASGKILGWFQDESEFGPRALGRRSILADPRKKGVRDFINAEIKFREDFRPFAPSVLLEDVARYFEDDVAGPYMLVINNIKAEWREKISEVVHVDGTCRVQTVTADWSPKYHQLLKEFKKITGISVLLNTSFNGVRMPIAETPDDAIRFFFSGKLDYLVIQNLIIKRVASRVASLPYEAVSQLHEM